ncbi:MAG: hypothetical protein KKG75_05305, partial [Nanoarchaeota archaeon]|nr:hypothetical protein [Nanoarchaeota archaeon]
PILEETMRRYGLDKDERFREFLESYIEFTTIVIGEKGGRDLEGRVLSLANRFIGWYGRNKV